MNDAVGVGIGILAVGVGIGDFGRWRGDLEGAAGMKRTLAAEFGRRRRG